MHCVDRFWERAAGGCVNFSAAFARLRLLAEQFGVRAPVPGWAGEVHCDRYIALGDDVGLLVVNRRAVTCIARGSISDAARDWRNQRRPMRWRRRTHTITAAEPSPAGPLGRGRWRPASRLARAVVEPLQMPRAAGLSDQPRRR